MSVIWPSTINSNILDENYLPYQGGNVVIVENENGPSQVRCKYTAVSTFHPIVLKFTLAEYVLFKAFVKDTLRYGTLSFYFPLPDDISDITETTSKLCRFYFSSTSSPPYKLSKIIADVAVYISFTLEEFAQ
jgi:hypothetical protein